MPSSFRSLLSSLAAFINTQTHVEHIEELLATLLQNRIINSDDVTAVRSLYLGNIKWQVDNYDAVREWFEANAVGRLAVSISVIALCLLRMFL
jgi:hypothetical protein